LLDPLGIRFVVEDMSREWTTTEKSTRALGLEGTVLANRIVWLGVALASLALTYLRFRFAHRVEGSWWKRWKRRREARAPVPACLGASASASIVIARVPRTFGFALDVRQTVRHAWDSFRTIATSWAGRATLLVIPLLTILVVLDQMESSGIPM